MIAGPRFLKYLAEHYRGWRRDDFDPPGAVLSGPSELAALDGAEHLLDCAGRQIYRVPLCSGGRIFNSFVYYFNNASYGRSLRRCYAFRSLRIASRLAQESFPSLQVLAALKPRREILNWRSVLVALEIESVPELILSSGLVTGLGRFLARFHARGFFHGDLKSRHVLVGELPGGAYQFHLVDLEKCLHLPRLPASPATLLAARDLVQLLVSLPLDPHDPMTRLLLDSYSAASPFSSREAARIRRIVELYSEGGGFRQGRTLLVNLVHLLLAGKRLHQKSVSEDEEQRKYRNQ
jgi:hypothetical protein